MYEKIYLKESSLRPHLDAPLRKERENYISQMEEKGFCIRYLQIASKYLLFAVRVLNLRDGSASVVLFEEIKADWIITEKGLSKETKKSRRIELQQFTTFLHSNGLTIDNASAEILDSYIQFRHNSGCNRKSIGTIVTSLRDFLRYANIRGWLPVDLSSALRGPRQFSLEQLPYAANWKDVQRLFDFYSGDSPACKRNRAIIVMFAVYGIRTSELTNLKIKDIDWKNEIITLHRAKRGRSQALPLMPIVGNALIRYFKESRRNDLGKTHLFINLLAPYGQMSRSGVYQVVSQAYHKLGISLEHVGAHSLRHSCASHLVNSGHSLKEVSDLLGHKQLDTTRIYAKIDLPNLRKVADINWEGLL